MVESPPISTKLPWIIGGSGLLRGPWRIWTRFARKMDMPIAEISGARRKEPRSGR